MGLWIYGFTHAKPCYLSTTSLFFVVFLESFENSDFIKGEGVPTTNSCQIIRQENFGPYLPGLFQAL